MSRFAPAFPPAHSRWLALIVALSVVVPVSACLRHPAATQPVAPPDVSDTQECGAAGLSDLVGQHFSALAGVDLRGALRVLHPMQAMTMDFSPSRLNARVDQSGMIRNLTCG
ncbi:MAG: hypothetical protein CFE34_07000 [Rhodobacteraceae bacterium PARR1]|nr:MAG: hypothetical protein CFE34_07000 [Rhodobacteraceae bacterium PARR1]